MNANRHIHYIGHHLHDVRRFFCYSTYANQALYRYALFSKTLYNCFGTKAGSFGNGFKNMRGALYLNLTR